MRQNMGDYALRPFGLSPVTRSQAKPAAAIAFTPPMKLPLKRTPKAEGDHEIINPALKAWMERAA